MPAKLAQATPTIMEPKEALAYFRRLIPELGTDPRFDDLMRRQAMTLAEVIETDVIAKVQEIIADRLATGAGISTAPHDIQDVLDRAGLSSSNPQRSEMIFRTNAMDAYNQGAQAEARKMVDLFPVWQYSSIADERSRQRHAALDGTYWDASKFTFTEVRGTDIGSAANCRCTMIYLLASDWAELEAEGKRLETAIPAF